MTIGSDREAIAVGVLYSLSGSLAASEAPLRDATLMALDEINQAGGALGRPVTACVADGGSQPATFACETERLLSQARVATLFGGWTSAARKAMRPVVERHGALLWYPLQYEGLEASSNILYTGICANQQLAAALQWLAERGRSRLYLLGSDYVFPRTLHKIARALMPRYGLTCIGEDTLARGETNFEVTIAAIADCQPDAILSTLNGDRDTDFYRQYRAAGLQPEHLPIVSVNITEAELAQLDDVAAAAGHYCTWSYFQSLPTAANQRFVRDFQARYGRDCVTSDPVEAAYVQVHLWKQAVERAGSLETAAVRAAVRGLEIEAPSGRLRVADNLNLARPCYTGRILPDGQFEIVSQTEPLEPQPWFGLETWDSPLQPAIATLLGEVSQSIQHSCQVEASARAQEALAAELALANQELRQTQEQLLAAKAREMVLERQLTSQIRNSLDLDTVLSSAVAEIAHLLDLDRCLFLWHRPDTAALDAAACTDRSVSQSLPPATAIAAAIGALALAGEGVLRLDATSVPEHLEPAGYHHLQQLDLQALLAAPVRTRSGRNGLVLCEQYSQPRVWREREQALLAAVVDQLAIAIEQAQLYERSQVTAAVAQARADQLKQALDELQQTQAHLVQTEKMSALGVLVAGLAHEIKNPVGFICGNLSYAQEYAAAALELLRLYQTHVPEPPEPIRQLAAEVELEFLLDDFPKTLESMAVGANRIQDLVLSLRNFSRTDRTGMETIDLHAGLDSALLILSHRLRPRGGSPAVEVSKDYGDLPPVTCYPSQLNQVFVNLLNNAIDALEEMGTASGEPGRIAIRTAIAGERVEIAIADNGPGMLPEVQQRLFDPFFTTKPSGKGTGLGLSISQQIIAKHGGQLLCRSEPGRGTEFTIQLQLAPVAASLTDEVA